MERQDDRDVRVLFMFSRSDVETYDAKKAVADNLWASFEDNLWAQFLRAPNLSKVIYDKLLK